MKNYLIELLIDKINDLIEINFSENPENIGYSRYKNLQKIFKSKITSPFNFMDGINSKIKDTISKLLMKNLADFRNPLNIYHYPHIKDKKVNKIKLFHPYDKEEFHLTGDPEIFYLPEIYEENQLNNIININKEIIEGEIKLKIIEGTGSSLDKGVKIPINSLVYSAESLDDSKIVIISDCAINLKVFFSAWFGTDYSIYNYYYAHFSQKYYSTHGKDGKDPPNYLSNNIVFSENKMFCFMGGLQDGNLIYFNIEDYCVPYIIETENFNKGKNTISSLVLLENYMDENYLICGDTCGNILLFSIKSEFCLQDTYYPSLDRKIQITKKKFDTNAILKGKKLISIHYKEITSMAINSSKDILVTSSEDCCINLISFPDFRIIKSIKQNYITNYIYIFNYPFPCLLTFSNNQDSYHQGVIRLLSLNGKELQSGNLNKFNHPRCIELYSKEDNNMSKVIFQSDHQNISIWNINNFRTYATKSFNGTNMVNYGICFDKYNKSDGFIINGYFGVRMTSKFEFQLEKLSKI